MSRKPIHSPSPDDGLDYRMENALMRMIGRQPEKPPLRFGQQFEANEDFIKGMVAAAKVRAEQQERETAEKAERKEERQWLRSGKQTLTELRQLLRQRAPSSQRRASPRGRTSRG